MAGMLLLSAHASNCQTGPCRLVISGLQRHLPCRAHHWSLAINVPAHAAAQVSVPACTYHMLVQACVCVGEGGGGRGRGKVQDDGRCMLHWPAGVHTSGTPRQTDRPIMLAVQNSYAAALMLRHVTTYYYSCNPQLYDQDDDTASGLVCVSTMHLALCVCIHKTGMLRGRWKTHHFSKESSSESLMKQRLLLAHWLT